MIDRPTLSRVDLEAFDAAPQGSGIEKRFRCPICQSDERALHVNLQTGAFNCKRASCHVKGLLTEFWKEPAPKLSRRARAQAQLVQAFGIGQSTAPVFIASVASSSPTPAIAGNWRTLWEAAAPIHSEAARRGAQYLVDGRGLSVAVAQMANVRFCDNWAPSPEGKNYRAGAAILYPTTSQSGEVVAVSGRYLKPPVGPDGKEIKARTGGEAKRGVFIAPAPLSAGGELLSPFDKRLPAVLIVEGQADALSLAACGFPAVATGGPHLADWLRLKVGLRRVVLASDNDKGGEELAARWDESLSGYGARCERLCPPNAKDWNAMLMLDGLDALTDVLAASVLLD